MTKSISNTRIHQITRDKSQSQYVDKSKTIVVANRNEHDIYSICNNEHCKRKYIPNHHAQKYCTKKCQTVWGNILQKIKDNDRDKIQA